MVWHLMRVQLISHFLIAHSPALLGWVNPK